MAADLHIHAMVGVTEDDLRCFKSSTLGSKWFSWSGSPCPRTSDCAHWKAVMDSPDVWVGAVSWLKAMLTDDDVFVPESVQAVQDLIGDELPTLDEELKAKLLSAIATPNVRAAHYETTTEESLASWLDKHMGERLFTVSW